MDPKRLGPPAGVEVGSAPNTPELVVVVEAAVDPNKPEEPDAVLVAPKRGELAAAVVEDPNNPEDDCEAVDAPKMLEAAVVAAVDVPKIPELVSGAAVDEPNFPKLEVEAVVDPKKPELVVVAADDPKAVELEVIAPDDAPKNPPLATVDVLSTLEVDTIGAVDETPKDDPNTFGVVETAVEIPRATEAVVAVPQTAGLLVPDFPRTRALEIVAVP